jgi:hypothetical protein
MLRLIGVGYTYLGKLPLPELPTLQFPMTSRFSIVTCFLTGIISVRFRQKSGVIQRTPEPGGKPGSRVEFELQGNLMDGYAVSYAGIDVHSAF